MPNTRITIKQKRHLLICIVLNKMTSLLKPFVNEEMEIYYNDLVTKYRINSKNSCLTSKVNVDEGLGLIFHDKSKKSHKTLNSLTDHNQLTRHYQQEHMCKNYTKILDDGADSQAILTMIERCQKFDSNLRDVCKTVKDQVRNSVSHCNWEEWTPHKYQECLRMMKSLGNHLGKP